MFHTSCTHGYTMRNDHDLSVVPSMKTTRGVHETHACTQIYGSRPVVYPNSTHFFNKTFFPPPIASKKKKKEIPRKKWSPPSRRRKNRTVRLLFLHLPATAPSTPLSYLSTIEPHDYPRARNAIGLAKPLCYPVARPTCRSRSRGVDVEVNASSVAARRGARHTTTRDGTPARPSRTSPDRYLRTYASRRTTNASQRSSWLFSPRPLRIDRRPETNDDERSVQQKEQRRGACEATTATSVDDGCDACGSSSTMTRPSGRPRPRLGSTEYRRRHREANTAGAGGHASSSTSRGPPPLAREPVRLVRRPGGFAF